MLQPRRLTFLAPVVFLILACSGPSAQQSTPKDPEALQKEIDALKAKQAEMQKSLDEVREFLTAATGGRFGAPSLVGAAVDLSGGQVNGQAGAPITIVEISDYHCPFCRRHVQQTQPKLYQAFVDTGKARHVFLHYPIAQLHPDAQKSHEAAMCAADQGKFWAFHLKLFENPLETVAQLEDLAKKTGLDGGAFTRCLESGQHTQQVKASIERIQKMNINGTPMFFIGRTPSGSEPMKIAHVIEGAQPFEAFKAAIDDTAAGK